MSTFPNLGDCARRLILVASAAFLAGCSTQVQVGEIDTVAHPLADNPEVNGLPFRVKQRYKLTLYRRENEKYVAVDASKTAATLADPDHLYVLRVRGSPLSDGTVTVKLNADNTLQQLTVDSKSKGQDALAAVGVGVKDLADARAVRAKADADRITTSNTSTTAAEDSRLSALQAKQAVTLAQAQLDALSASATAVDRLTAQQNVDKLKLAANQAARRASEPLPYPDVGT